MEYTIHLGTSSWKHKIIAAIFELKILGTFLKKVFARVLDSII